MWTQVQRQRCVYLKWRFFIIPELISLLADESESRDSAPSFDIGQCSNAPRKASSPCNTKD